MPVGIESGSLMQERQVHTAQEYLTPWKFEVDDKDTITTVTLDANAIFFPGTTTLNTFGADLYRLDNRLARLSEGERYDENKKNVMTPLRREEVIAEAQGLAEKVGLPFQPHILEQFHTQFAEVVVFDTFADRKIPQTIETVVFDKRTEIVTI